MGLINKPFDFEPNTPMESAKVDTNFDTAYNEINGKLTNVNLAADAAISQSKITNLITDLATKLSDAGDTITGPFLVKFDLPYVRLIGTEASAKDFKIVEAAGLIVIQVNTGTEAAPIWITRYQFRPDGPAETLDVTNKAYVDRYTRENEVNRTVKVDTFATGSGIFVAVDGLSVSMTTRARRVQIGFTGSVHNAEDQGKWYCGLHIDNVYAGILTQGQNETGWAMPASLTYITDILSEGSHLFQIWMKCDSGSAVLEAPSAIWAWELPR